MRWTRIRRSIPTLFLLAAWQVLSWLVGSGVLPLRARTNILPGPLEVFPIFFAELPGQLGGHFLVSLWRVLASMALAVVLAVPAGLVMGQSRALNRLFSPLVYLTYPVPKVVLVPVVVLFFGVGDASKIIVITLILFFQILVLVRDAAASLRAELIDSVRSLGAGRRALFFYVYLPASLPAMPGMGAALSAAVFDDFNALADTLDFSAPKPVQRSLLTKLGRATQQIADSHDLALLQLVSADEPTKRRLRRVPLSMHNELRNPSENTRLEIHQELEPAAQGAQARLGAYSLARAAGFDP